MPTCTGLLEVMRSSGGAGRRNREKVTTINAALRRELDMARADIGNHAKTLSQFTERFLEIAAWQAKKDIEDARREEREKIMVRQLAAIFRLGWAILTVLLSGFGLAFVAFVVRGGLSVAF